MADLTSPKTITTTRTITRFEIRVNEVILNTSATIELLLFDGDLFVDLRIIELTGEAYSLWGNEDTYIISYCENYINTTL